MNYSMTLKITSIIILIISLVEVAIGFLLFVSDIYINKYISEMTEPVLIGEDIENTMGEFDDDDDESDWERSRDVLKTMYKGYIENPNKADITFFEYIKKLRFIATIAGSIATLTGLIGIVAAVLGFLPPRVRRINLAFCLGAVRAVFSVVLAAYQLTAGKADIVDVAVIACIFLYLLCIYKIKKMVKSEEKLIENADGLEEVVDLIE
ncbi:MAG: hypothetical protein IKS17_00045 [Firmicutes bacterium]|nr:hypothetical protein [Bacillota bacterium]